jgi:hypothetical protein
MNSPVKDGRWFLWTRVAVALVLLAWLLVPALLHPWTWDWQQDFLAFYIVCFCALAAMCAWIWFRRGTEGLKAAYRMLAEHRAKPRSLRSNILNYALWTGIAVALVIYFNAHGR